MPAAGFREELGYARYGGQRMELLIVDCAYIEAVSAELRADLLETAAFGSDDVWEADRPEGWTSPDAENGPWYARYEFRNTLTSYKPHFWAGERWDKMRRFVRTGLRTALDEFSAPLFWGEYNWETADPPFTLRTARRRAHGAVNGFSSFAALVTEWGEVATEAAARRWVIIGLKC